MITAAEAEACALRRLWALGPRTIGPVRNGVDFAAASVFLALVKKGFAKSTSFGRGYVQFSLTPAGIAVFKNAWRRPVSGEIL